MKTFIKTLFIAGLAGLFGGCLYEKGGPLPSDTSTNGGTDTNGEGGSTAALDSLPCGSPTTTNAQNQVCFNTAILPIFLANCATSGCHDSKTAAEGYDLTSYDKIVRKGISVGNSKKSKLYQVIIDTSKERMPPPPNAPMSSDKIQLIASWIDQGAKNITCETSGSTNSTQVASYSKHLVPIFDYYCTGCHNSTTQSGNINLTGYANVQTLAKNGKLYGAITHASGYQPMPSSSLKLSDCQIGLVKKWIDSGMLNN
ncbi:MAG TPA: hypothetical protein DCR35_08125 [Runella sp.]|nr:hypothetical protein [Runella sp.]HAO49259.1 hypothetical protein [Runella sp.]